jgi:hypothetical protein
VTVVLNPQKPINTFAIHQILVKIFQTFPFVARAWLMSCSLQGLSASLLRQVTYSSTRFGAYGPIKELISGDNPNPSMALKVRPDLKGRPYFF